MTRNTFTTAIIAFLTFASLPLACSEAQDPPEQGDGGAGGSGMDAGGEGGRAAGGIGAASGGARTGGSGGNPPAGSGGRASGGSATGGNGGAGGGGGEPSGGNGGEPIAGMGGFGGESGGGGGEDGVDQDLARCERICAKAFTVVDESCDTPTCVYVFCELLNNPYPHCRPYADGFLRCLDEEAPPEQFTCWDGHASAYAMETLPCWDEYQVVHAQHCDN
jgi:hypothetical protein